MRHVFSSFFTLSSLCFLGACASTGPGLMPRGYVTGSPFDTPTHSEAASIGYDFSIEKNQAVLADTHYAAHDLAVQLDTKLSFGMDSIYLTNAESKSAFYSAFDYALRSELMGLGYKLSHTPDDAVSIVFVAQDPVSSGGKKTVKAEQSPYRELYLALAINVVEDVPQDFVSGVYEVPVYDYKPSNALDLQSLSPEEEKTDMVDEAADSVAPVSELPELPELNQDSKDMPQDLTAVSPEAGEEAQTPCNKDLDGSFE